MNSREKGTYYETLACEYLTDRGFVVLERNFRCPAGEIDVIGRDGPWLVFVEVKARKSPVSGSGAEAVTHAKQKKICRAADYYRTKHGIGDFSPIRYDCVSIDGEQTTWYKAAFEHVF
ncbi:MAG: YraN family protein [Lachnospiraceae bacterium]|nr:YraN family protein [Lachnospiraceae bacterium]